MLCRVVREEDENQLGQLFELPDQEAVVPVVYKAFGAAADKKGRKWSEKS